MGPAMLLSYDTEIAHRRDLMLADFMRARRRGPTQRRRLEGALRSLTRLRLALRHSPA